jgi:hypothetical protein
MFVVMIGNIAHGFSPIGPFTIRADAEQFCVLHQAMSIDMTYMIMELSNPDDFMAAAHRGEVIPGVRR